MNRSQQKLLAETAALAGELMLNSGAETFRAEDTMAHILKKGTTERVTPLALTTAILVTLEHNGQEPLTIVRRVSSGSINLNRIVQINEISREYCSDQITLEDAYYRLNHLKSCAYPRSLYNIGTVSIAVGFSLFFGGSWIDVSASFLVTIVLALLITFGKQLKMTSFITTCLACACMSFSCAILHHTLFTEMNMDTVIISSLMPVVPGVAITNAVRDTLQGDYLSGCARVLEALLKASSIALGVGIGIMLHRFFI